MIESTSRHRRRQCRDYLRMERIRRRWLACSHLDVQRTAGYESARCHSGDPRAAGIDQEGGKRQGPRSTAPMSIPPILTSVPNMSLIMTA